jgi:hypothetical protein
MDTEGHGAVAKALGKRAELLHVVVDAVAVLLDWLTTPFNHNAEKREPEEYLDELLDVITLGTH